MPENKELVASAIIRARAELEQALAELEKVPSTHNASVAYSAHALNNYLTVTGGTLDLVLMRLADYPDDLLRTWLHGAQHATNLMARIVGQLMTNSAAAEVPLRLESFDLPTMLQRVCSYYQHLADRKSIRLTLSHAADVPRVWADRVAVAAVLDNLVSNAVKYSPHGGAIQLQVWGESGSVVCSIQDSGPGLSPDDQARLFQRGARLTPRPTGGETSTGYGLAVAKDLIDRLGGDVWCESALGQGSRFLFRLPTQPRPSQTATPSQATPAARP